MQTHESLDPEWMSGPAGPGPIAEGVHDMGKYILGWLLGVPAIVLVIIYLFFN